MGTPAMVQKMLDCSNIEIKLNCEFSKDMERLARKTLYTGSLDNYFNNQFGPLPYRSLEFEWTYGKGDVQGNAIVNYTEEQVPYTRQVEHKHFYNQTGPLTVLSREFPKKWEPGRERYYPINNGENDQIYSKYKNLANNKDNLIIGGRLASYRYWNMDQTIGAAMKLVYNSSESTSS